MIKKFNEFINESLYENKISKDELEKLEKVKKLAKKYKMEPVKNPKKWVKKNGYYEKGIVPVAVFLHPEQKDDFGFVEVFYDEDNPEELAISYYAWGPSGNDSIDSWTKEDTWEEEFGEKESEDDY